MARTEYGTTWWGRKWLDALTGIDLANRIPRGKSYANTGKVYSLTLDEKRGLIKARVKGHYDPFYSVKVTLPRVSQEKARQFIEEIAKSPVVLAGLSARMLDPEVLTIAEKLHIQVFPRKWNDLHLQCSCPDFAVPCKHIAAVIYKISQEIDANPFVLFSLIGIDIFAGLEEYGLKMDQTQVSEMPAWKDLLVSGVTLQKKPLSSLNELSYTSFEDIRESLLGLFTDTPAGYAEGSLKEELSKILQKTVKAVEKQLADKTDRDLPVLNENSKLFSVDAWGHIDEGVFSYTLYPAGQQEQRCVTGREGNALMCDMFSGSIDKEKLADVPEEIEALYQLWLIAAKLTITGNIMPQIYEPITDFFAVRWIPAVISDLVRKTTAGCGQALLSLREGSYFIDRAPENLSAEVLGQLMLSLFISDFVKRSYRELKADVYDENPYRRALFEGEAIDTEDYLNGESIKMSLESWLSPLYLESLELQPVIVLTDNTVGGLKDLVDERRGSSDSLNVDVDDLQKEEEYLKELLSGVLKEDEPFVTDGVLPDREHEAELQAAAADLRQEAARGENAALQGSGRDTYFDGRADLSEALVVPADEPALDPDEVRADLFSNQTGVDIAMGFREGQGSRSTILSLQDVIERQENSGLRFECLRTVSRLSQVCPQLRMLLENHGGKGTIALEDLAFVVSSALPALKLLGVELVIPKALKRILTPKASLTIDTTESFGEEDSMLRLEDILAFDWNLALGSSRISEAEFKELSKKTGQIVRFRNQYVYVDSNEMQRIAKRLANTRAESVPSRRLIAAALTGKFGQDNVLLTQNLKNALDKLLSEKSIAVPETLNATLRPYQERGYSWLIRNIKTSMGSVIADDMGLGKTLQVISAIEKMRLDGMLEERGVLIVVPTSLLMNWQHEIKRFAPALTFKQFYGKDRTFEPLTHVTITTYGVLRSELAAFKKEQWALLVIDEAQAIKSHTSQIFKAVRQIKATSFIAMSGTPVENRLMEYWSIMDFANPGLLGGIESFKREFAAPIERTHDAEAINRFRNVTAPFIMRRLKSDKSVISDLPDKLTYDRYCPLTPVQTALYNDVVNSTMELLQNSAGDMSARNGAVLGLIGNLKQICNSPEQFSEDSTFKGPDYSGKAQVLFSLLDELFASRRKVLIFTQFKKTGRLLAQWIAERYGFEPDFLHGEIPMKERQKMVERFKQKRDLKAFILSIKAAGTGLNLTAASAVVHFDLWWNPAVEEQATDRAYRIGQQEQVEVYRFICANTFEERVNDILQSKKELADLTVGTGESWIGDLSNRQLEEIFAISDSDEELKKGQYAPAAAGTVRAPRKAGRPRKSVTDPVPEAPAAAEAAPKRRRGRPRKNAQA